MQFAVSILAMKQVSGDTTISHCAAVIEAANCYEAEGKAMEAARKLLPPTDGWTRHDV